MTRIVHSLKASIIIIALMIGVLNPAMAEKAETWLNVTYNPDTEKYEPDTWYWFGVSLEHIDYSDYLLGNADFEKDIYTLVFPTDRYGSSYRFIDDQELLKQYRQEIKLNHYAFAEGRAPIFYDSPFALIHLYRNGKLIRSILYGDETELVIPPAIRKAAHHSDIRAGISNSNDLFTERYEKGLYKNTNEEHGKETAAPQPDKEPRRYRLYVQFPVVITHKNSLSNEESTLEQLRKHMQQKMVENGAGAFNFIYMEKKLYDQTFQYNGSFHNSKRPRLSFRYASYYSRSIPFLSDDYRATTFGLLMEGDRQSYEAFQKIDITDWVKSPVPYRDLMNEAQRIIYNNALQQLKSKGIRDSVNYATFFYPLFDDEATFAAPFQAANIFEGSIQSYSINEGEKDAIHVSD